MCTETVLLSLSETHCQFRLLQRERWPTPWIFLDLVNNQCPILIGSFTLLRSYLTNSVTVYECEPISIQSYFHAIKIRILFSHSLVDSNKTLMETRKVLEIRWPTVIKCMRDVLGVSKNTNDYAEKDSAILKSEGGGGCSHHWKSMRIKLRIFQKDKDLFLTFFMRYI